MAQGPAAALAELDDYELLDTIGEGRHGKVKLGRHLPTGTDVAVKIIQRLGISRHPRPDLQEVRCMLGLRHPNIVQLFQVIDTEEALFLVMEYVSRGDLWEYLELHGRMAEGAARRTFRQLVSAVDYCHGKGIIHRDVKPQNVLFDINMNARLADFSMSTPFGGSKLSTGCGTPIYAAPELFEEGEYDGPPVDIWSLGVVLYHMVTGTTPFKGKNLIQLALSIGRGLYSMPGFLTIELQHLLSRLITRNPKDRSSLREIMPDLWLNKGHMEELRPFTEPGGEDLDPGVEQQMVDMGFEREEIENAVTHRTYDKIMATYLMLSAEKSRIQYQTILVRPYRSSDPNSFGSSPDQEAWTEQPPKDLESGQETEDSSGPSGSSTSRKAIPGPSLKSRTTGLPPNPDSDSDSDSRPTTPPPMPEDSRPNDPPPMPEDSMPTHPPPTAELGARPTPPPPTAEDSRSTHPPPRAEDSRPTRDPTMPEDSRPTHPPPTAESGARPTPPPPMPDSDSRPTTPPPMPEQLRTTHPTLNRKPKNASPRPAPQYGPGDFPSTHNTSSTRSSSSSRGTAEGKSKGRRGLARRCFSFLRKLCCLPTRKGCSKSNQTKPV